MKTITCQSLSDTLRFDLVMGDPNTILTIGGFLFSQMSGRHPKIESKVLIDRVALVALLQSQIQCNKEGGRNLILRTSRGTLRGYVHAISIGDKDELVIDFNFESYAPLEGELEERLGIGYSIIWARNKQESDEAREAVYFPELWERRQEPLPFFPA
ncbi:hypothetical protein A2917_02550 [Candidatus Nomurabacteria bacterium RIFCSPLOWO2_01_FULL_42_17]|uniref:Uncharacterized protein n=1 Tax=Candidatus Nomurabacteria bacterium RIFCSPLOWO2_01_FULL_42_17 TaxID=1801780 RepID=A0A1F6XMP4_9BACT|nr:MAG: hypothetical protein A2917_02550 [Candidatus Nomurabacteria bacterium RIFCSPLOWO2_01_FULL_42_17]